jgi:SARP family transcriptional regulator, regulator of embCAB operon
VVISNLRRALADGVAADPQLVIRTAAGGYALSVADQHYDLERFRAARSQGNDARASRRPAEAAEAYGRALAEWSGLRGLEDLAGVPFADAFAQTAEQELLAVEEARVEAALACGRHAELVSELYELVRRHPFNDVLCGQLLTALGRSGRTADAAEQYHRFREEFQHELGLSVPDTLRRVWGAVSRHEDSPDHYGAPSGRPQGERTIVDDALARLRGELVHGNGARDDITGRLTIGRVGCDLVLADAKVSKTHAVILPTSDGFVITDLHSTNGTFVNGDVVVGPRLLEHLDRIRMGGTELVFRTLTR